ncbi:EscU/YscU/HrcU family type III secretion system export apparatus switch protein [Catenovulum sp. 2E275]|uniref:EscU/YscU/HrcU family type III secretion system export apparatus switch protein n=1 Tax=Catenovulum sp. 2E275 TaxID=2980497 RepID=UPI0021D3A717|nr:EscU/YscU/HrcU family type III secretion system export apparatus switch protein [Catenovulum sp. 2E275]MCU4675793.1 EscU/YscU/HrcU family type III secretion system export apparatus switch protein [Catenovulum sp. 2E275]
MTEYSKKSPKTAISLTYPAPQTPKVVAKGYDHLAEHIIEQAKQAGILVHQDQELAAYLSKLDVGSEIPREIYIIIAELIAWSYMLQGMEPDEWNNIHNRIDHKI